MKKKMEPKFKPKSLFGNPNPAVIIVNEPKEIEIIAEPTNVVEGKTAIVKKSEKDGWISIYQPDDSSDRFVLISPKNERFACKFYNPIRKDFVGASMLSMYNLRDHFDRNIIPEDEGLK